MARVQVPQGADERPILPAGIYGGGGSARIITAEVRDVPGENKDNEQYLDLGVLVQYQGGGIFAHTQPFGGSHTRLTPKSGSKVEAFVARLGFDPRDFDPEDLKELPVILEVGTRKGKDGEERNYIINVSKES